MSWEQLKAILDIRRQEAREANKPPETCPIDGTPLEVNSKGVRNCPMGDFRYDGGPVYIGQQ